jgi:heterodisulfide reductase subunit C
VVQLSEEPVERRAHELGEVFLNAVYGIPGGEKIKQCIQCGTCSASCPTSYAMDYSPREIIAAFRAGMLDRVLKSNTVWLCSSCYYCTVRCPSGIKLTDIMYELKRLGVEFGLVEEHAIAPTLSKAFVDLVDKYGRVPETTLVMRVLLRTKPLAALKMMPQGLKLLMRGRLPLFPHRIAGISEMNKCAGAMSEALVSGLHAGGTIKEEA